ncbi:MAG: tetratricopeptide repeat protein [Gammaproteobacteria bacterium]|nr:tetratricopeptide repeat protein [Gammaproteobacteria bacterium]
MKTFFKEARRRKVFRMTALYVVAAWVAIQVAGEAFDAFVMPEAALRQVWVGALLGLPLFLIFSWYYDIGSQGIVRTPPANPDEYIDLSLGKADYIIISVLLVFAVLISVPLIDEISRAKTDRQSATSVREAPPNSIAVLPFLNLSGEKNNEYFSDGISEELLNKLAHLSGLRVAARTSSFYFKGKDVQIPVVAAQLGVRTILEGSVRKAGNKVRVTVQLINASDGYHLWSKTFDRELGDIFAIQDEIATQVVDALKVTLLGSEANRLSHHSTENIDAYNAYLLGRQRMAQRTSTTLREAVEYFDRAIDLDPAFALAYVGLADAYNHLATWGTLSREEALANAEPAVTRALQLDGQLGEAYAALGFVLQGKHDRDGAQAAYKKAIELNPSYADSYQRYGVLLKWDFGRVEDALPLHKKALELDPLSTSLNMSVAEDYHEMGRFEEALKQCQRVIEIDPDFPRAYSLMADLYWEVFGRVDEGARWLRKAVELDPGNPSHARWLAMVYLDLGDLDAATYWVDQAIASATDQIHTKWSQLLFAYYKGNR